MTDKQVERHVYQRMRKDGIEDSYKEVARDIIIAAKKLNTKGTNDGYLQALEFSYHIYLRSFDSMLWADKWYELVES